MANINEAFTTFNNVMQRELALLHVKVLETSGPLKAPEQCCELDRLTAIENSIAELKQMYMNIEKRLQPPVNVNAIKHIACSLTSSIDKIEEKLNEIEQSIPEETIKEDAIDAEVPLIVETIKEVATAPAPAPAPAPVEEEGEEEGSERSESPHEEESPEEAEEEVEEEAEDEELTEFRYKGKTYYMDSECIVYSVNDEGEPVEVGKYDETTRKITFN